MIKYTPASERKLSLFRTPFDQQLDPENRWVKMADVVPWDKLAMIFFSRMSMDQGRASIDLRIVLGALLVKHIMGLSDEDAILYIQENIYAQYFVGLPNFQTSPVFTPSLFVEIRKRLGEDGARLLNDKVLEQAQKLQAIKHNAPKGVKSKSDQDSDRKEEGQGPQEAPEEQAAKSAEGAVPSEKAPNRGTLKLDATVAPQHIGYPTDVKLLHQGRRYSEGLIDKLFNGAPDLWDKKPRTYRRTAQNEYLGFSKKRKKSKKDIKRMRGKQLRYLARNLRHIDRMLLELKEKGLLPDWTQGDWDLLGVLIELHRQQEIMHRDKRKRINDRIVSITQPWVRPIKRGKAGKETEFGAKLNVSETEGFVRLDQVNFDNFNEAKGLEMQIEAFRALYGHYPEVVLVDQIYLNRENRKFLADKGIRHCGAPLGRPPEMSKEEKLKRKKEQNKRSEIEGKFGQGKSKYGLDDIKMRREDTSYACIGLILLALNVIKLGQLYLNLILAIITRWIACESRKKSTLKAMVTDVYFGRRLRIDLAKYV